MGQGRRDTNFTKDLEVTRMEQGLNAESPRRWMRCAESGGKNERGERPARSALFLRFHFCAPDGKVIEPDDGNFEAVERKLRLYQSVMLFPCT